ncbi:MAG: hypothetical protein NT172_16630 [Planctomycetota bacterium]|nr:hypothetical protein [Planctomycetota bacterium]
MNHHPDLTPGVMAALSWFYLSSSILNACASAYISYGELVSEGASRDGLGPKTISMPSWLRMSTWLFYGFGSLFLLINMQIAYWLLATGTVILAIFSAADAALFAEHESHDSGLKSSLNQHQPAIGIGGPLSRPIISAIWSFVAMIFATMGMTYALGAEYAMPQLFRNAIDNASGATSFFTISTLAFIAMIVYRKLVANGILAWAALNFSFLFFGLSLTDYDFRDIVTKPDNVPIIGLIYLVAYFTWLGLRRAVINDARMAKGLPNLEELGSEKTLTWPDLVYTELIALVMGTVFLIIWSILLQAPLEQPASSTQAPNPSKAPWYFLGLQEMLVYFDPWMAGVVLPTFIVIGMMAMPYIDTNKAGNGYYTIRQRMFAYSTFQYGFLVLWVVLILLGTFLRGPNWNFFGPYEYWDLHKLEPLNNVNLSDIFWIQWLRQSRPSAILIREAPGILLTMGYFAVLPRLMYAVFFKKYVMESGFIRYSVLAMLLLFMASLPIKMVLRWTINLKYIVAIPEYFFNI